jgi:hypothetical protein
MNDVGPVKTDATNVTGVQYNKRYIHIDLKKIPSNNALDMI